ncbi:hypothetical protein D3227_38240 [Mesorhizobium waimense]|uniref:RHS repeat protein n=1 Tax=Mesorhizobium waimense TaxID=1300307 RepID=A0A3A5JSH5_9HYPH|nr:hypothetical protein D3227_38240 [Mesorhizobium waimense]
MPAMTRFGKIPLRARRVRTYLAALVLGFLGEFPADASASTSYTYDSLGRLETVLYDNGLCIAYTYDANGNRTAITTISTTPGAPKWGSGVWGCIPWTP